MSYQRHPSRSGSCSNGGHRACRGTRNLVAGGRARCECPCHLHLCPACGRASEILVQRELLDAATALEKAATSLRTRAAAMAEQQQKSFQYSQRLLSRRPA
jgi:hypothetical protein